MREKGERGVLHLLSSLTLSYSLLSETGMKLLKG